MTPERLNEIDHLPNVSIFTVRELTQEIRNLRSQLEAEKEKNRWISVKETVPTNKSDVLVYNEFFLLGFFDPVTRTWWDDIGDREILEVTHWRPLPEGPEEKE